MNSKELWAERNRLSDEQLKAVNDGREQDAFMLSGQIKMLDQTLNHILEEEDKLRTAPKAKKLVTLADMVLGSRDEFRGLNVGFKKQVNNAASVVSVDAPTETDLYIPEKIRELYPTFGETIPEMPADGSIQYLQRSTQTGEPDAWGGVTSGTSATKAQVLYSWTEQVANKETIAGYVPVSKSSLKDYLELENVINNDLLIDLYAATNEKYLNGDNSTGIVGITNTTGIQTHELGSPSAAEAGGAYYEAIRKMRTMVMKKAKRIPTHVVLSPDAKEAIDLYKTATGLYQTLGSYVYWGLQVIEDPYAEGILVYDCYSARRRAIHGGATVEVGYYNDQFIKNELSILAEWDKAFQVYRPDAFVYAEIGA